MSFTHRDVKVTWLGYATARLEAEDGPTVYTDPGRYGIFEGEWADRYGGAPHPNPGPFEPKDGDIVVVTHDHHYDSSGVNRVANSEATVVVYAGVDATNIARDVETVDELPYDVRRVEYGDSLDVNGATVSVVPAYNELNGPRANADGTVPHPEGFGCGYLIEIDGIRALWPGDSDVLPDHHSMDPTLFLPPIGRSFTMDQHEAAELADAIRPELVCPIHYNTFPDLRADSRAFASDVAASGVPVVLDESDS